MSSLFEDLREGLLEAIDYEKGFGQRKMSRLGNLGVHILQDRHADYWISSIKVRRTSYLSYLLTLISTVIL